MSEMKICTKCQESKQKTEFGPNKRSADKLNYRCKPCYAELGKQIHARKQELLRELKIQELTEADEKWCDIINYEGLYQISNLGKVLSLRSNKILKLKNHRDGYLYVTLSKNNIKKTHKIHRLVASAFVEGDKTLDVDHIDQNRQNNKSNNLRWVSKSENSKNRKIKGGVCKNQQYFRCYISNNDGKQIKKCFKTEAEAYEHLYEWQVLYAR